MNREYKRYLDEDQHFDRQTLMGIFDSLQHFQVQVPIPINIDGFL